MPKGSKLSIRSDELQHDTLVSKLLSVAKWASPNEKSLELIEYLICLKTPSHGINHSLRQTRFNALEREDFVAVSYSQKPMLPFETKSTASYTVTCLSGQSRQSRARDQALDRAIRFASAIGCGHIWIDEECLPDPKSKERSQALDSMDLVYERSYRPLGLLAVILNSQEQINILENLITCSYLDDARDDPDGDDDSYPELCHQTSESTIERVLDFLRYLSLDRWWNRAWIFQEEYVSSTGMHLLLRHEPNLKIPASLKKFSVPREVCINASKFRRGATLFLLAAKRSADQARKRDCAKRLKRFGKYNILCEFQQDFHRRAMSSRIFSDVGRRGVKHKHDLLPIVANSCNYAIRFDAASMAEAGYSVALCALAMYIFNGELLRNCDEVWMRADGVNLGVYLQHISFHRFEPPVSEKKLSFLKTCRLPRVSLSHQGVHTHGHLWKVVGVLETGTWSEPWTRSDKRHCGGLDNEQRDHLLYLMYWLRRDETYGALTEHLQYYLDDDLKAAELGDAAKNHMDLMAEAVVAGIVSEKTLYVIEPLDSSQHGRASGILVGLRGWQSRVFTSWTNGEDTDGKERRSRVSLEVHVTPADPPLLKTLRWVNGIVFFSQRQAEEVVFEWPKTWTTINHAAVSAR